MSAFIGVDLGTKRIGLAVATEGVATPLEVIDRTDDETDAKRIAAIAQERDATIVVGYPLRLDGSAGPAAEQAQEFAGALRAQGISPVLWDERLTTKSAERTMIDAGARRSKRRAVIDKLAATLILQSYLDSNI